MKGTGRDAYTFSFTTRKLLFCERFKKEMWQYHSTNEIIFLGSSPIKRNYVCRRPLVLLDLNTKKIIQK